MFLLSSYIIENDIIVIRSRFRHVDAVCSQIGERKYIGVRRGMSEIEEREAVAHEIGHIEDGTVGIIHVRIAEHRADDRAREILIPYDDLMKAVEDDGGECDACTLAQRFGVSVETMAKRIRELFHIS